MKKISEVSEIESFEDLELIENQIKIKILLSENQLRLRRVKWQYLLSPSRLADSMMQEFIGYFLQNTTRWLGKLFR